MSGRCGNRVARQGKGPRQQGEGIMVDLRGGVGSCDDMSIMTRRTWCDEDKHRKRNCKEE